MDFRGFEVSKTRSSSFTPPKCDDDVETREAYDDECPLYKCGQDCEHGFRIDDKGCRTCDCVEPCSEISCRGDGETCR